MWMMCDGSFRFLALCALGVAPGVGRDVSIHQLLLMHVPVRYMRVRKDRICIAELLGGGGAGGNHFSQ